MMADLKSCADAGVEFMEAIADGEGKVAIPLITDPRGVDLSNYRPLGQTEEMANLELAST